MENKFRGRFWGVEGFRFAWIVRGKCFRVGGGFFLNFLKRGWFEVDFEVGSVVGEKEVERGEGVALGWKGRGFSVVFAVEG